MTKMINKITGTEMWVSDDRVSEYIALGHRKTVPTLDDLEKPTDIEKAIKRVRKKKV